MTSEQRVLLVPDDSADSQRISVMDWETKRCTDLNGHSLPTSEEDGSTSSGERDAGGTVGKRSSERDEEAGG